MHRFRFTIQGALFRMWAAQARRAARMPGVAWIEEDAEIELS